MHMRKRASLSTTWALIIAAILLYVPANLLPMMVTASLLGSQEDTIMSGVVFLWQSGSWPLAAVVFAKADVIHAHLIGEHGLIDEIANDLIVRQALACLVNGHIAERVERKFESLGHDLFLWVAPQVEGSQPFRKRAGMHSHCGTTEERSPVL